MNQPSTSPRSIFGTDGIRYKAGTSYLEPAWLHKIGATFVAFCKQQSPDLNPIKIAIGQDTRASSPTIYQALAAGITAAGGVVYDLGVVPTAVVSLVAGQEDVAGGLMVTASHNPASYNGVKFFDQQGYKLSTTHEQELSQSIIASDAVEVTDKPNVQSFREQAVKIYLSTLERSLAGSLAFDSVKIVIDCANGATSKIVPALMKSLGLDVTPINNGPDGTNINEDCGSLAPQKLQQFVIKNTAHLGLAFDGDGDRIVICDEKGDAG